MEKEKAELLLKNIVGAIIIGVVGGLVFAVIMSLVTKNIFSGILWGGVALIPILMSIADDLMIYVWSAKRPARYVVQALIFLLAFGFMAPRLLRLLPPQALGLG